jgi:Cd2+/Zn2+-exporting ATPase
MKSAPANPEKPPAGPGPCLVRSVAVAFAEEPALEAVTIHREDNTVSLATLGRVDGTALECRLRDTLQDTRGAEGQASCQLLAGAPDCGTCETVTDPATRARLVIRREGPRTTIARVSCPTAPRFWRWRTFALPRVVPREVELPEDEHALNEWKWQLLAAGLCGVFALAAWFLGDRPYALAFHLAAYVAGGWFATIEVWERLRHRVLDVHFLMLAVAAGSASIGKWDEGSVLLFLFALSGGLEHYALGRTQREIKSLFRSAPKVATVLDARGGEHETPVEQLCPGQRILVKPGALFPVDAEVVKGRTAADESNLTGEAVPVEKGLGDIVLAGTMNLWGAVEATVLRPAQESALQKIIRLIREAQHLRAPSQRFTDRFGTGYTYGVLGLTAAMFFVWWLAAGHPAFQAPNPAHTAFYRAMTLLVVASPCALVLSIPSAILAAIAWGARRGVLFRGGAAVEKLAEADVVAMDKTGTLTTGDLQVERVESFPPGREAEVARLAFSLERLSTHPLARAVTRHGKQQRLEPLELDHFESATGLGIQARWQGRPVALGRREWIEATFGPVDGVAAPAAADAGHSEVWLAAGDLRGRLLFRDDLRPQARTVVEELRRLGLQTLVLTGDRSGPAAALKTALGLDDVRAELRPEQKVAAIQELIVQGRRVAMIGDGVNDAPSLAVAHVGVAMGARGSDTALEQAEIVLMHDRLENFLAAYRLSQRARRVIWQNLVISLGTVVVLVGAALFGSIPLTLGVIGHEGSTVVVVMNSLRLLLGGGATSPATLPAGKVG